MAHHYLNPNDNNDDDNGNGNHEGGGQPPEEDEAYLDESQAVQVIELDDDDEQPMEDDDDDMEGLEVEFDDGDYEDYDEEADGMEDDGEMMEETSQVQFREHQDSIYCVATHPTNFEIAVTGGGDDVAYVWNIATGAMLFKLSGHTDTVIDIGFNFDGQYIATGGMDGLAKIWESATGNLVSTLEGPDEITWIDWHPRGNVLIAGAVDGSVYMWSLNGTLMQVFAGHAAPVSAGGFTPDGKTIVSASEDSTLIIWDPKTAVARFRISGEDGRFHQGMITSIAFHPDSQLIATASADNTLKILHLENHKILTTFAHNAEIERVAFCPTLPILASGSSDGKICLWDIQTLRQRHVLEHDDCIVKLEWHKTAPYLASTSVDKVTKVWDGRNGQAMHEFKGGRAAILDMAISTNHQAIITVGDDRIARVYHLAQ